jgi:hypothetical protein
MVKRRCHAGNPFPDSHNGGIKFPVAADPEGKVGSQGLDRFYPVRKIQIYLFARIFKGVNRIEAGRAFRHGFALFHPAPVFVLAFGPAASVGASIPLRRRRSGSMELTGKSQ